MEELRPEELEDLVQELEQEKAETELQKEKPGNAPLQAGWAARSAAQESAEPPALWVRILTAPLVAYMFLGTGLLFLVSKTESLAEALADRYGDSGLRGVKATEWHAREMWLPIAFPITFPILGIRAVLMLLFAAAYVALHLPAEGWRVVGRLLGQAWRWFAGLLVTTLLWLARPIKAAWRWLATVLRRAWVWMTSAIRTAWVWITRPIKAA